jgi:hypothetical protein
MLAFLESALLQPEEAQINDSTSGDFDQRLGSLMTQLGKQSKATKPEGSQEPEPEMASFPIGADASTKAPGLAAAVLELVDIAAQISRVDQMIAQVTTGAPDADEAKRWHEISLRALQCSRDMLLQKQTQCLEGLRGSSPEATPAINEVSPPPGLTQSPNWMGWSQEAVEACPEFVPQIKTFESGGGSLRRDLEVLRERNPERVLIVRKIKKLGFESPTLLSEHFQQYGQVAEVLVAHSHVRPTPKRPNGRVRPAALGFMVMASEEAAQSALQAGAMQAVCGVTIDVSSFESFDRFYEAGDDEEEK